MPQQDQYDKEGRFIGRTGGVAGVDYGIADQNNDALGSQIAAYNRAAGNPNFAAEQAANAMNFDLGAQLNQNFGSGVSQYAPTAAPVPVQTAEQQMKALVTPNDPTGYIKQQMNNFDQRVQKQNVIGITKDTNY
jgi:hypothetical protein